MAYTLRDKLNKETVLLDGAFGTYAHSLGVSEKDFGDYPGCMEYLSVSSPELISRIHEDYLEAGSDAVETDTFGGNGIKLAEYGLSGKVYDINLAATKLARQAADKFSTTTWPRYVIGSMGPTGKLPSSTDPVLGNISYKQLYRAYHEQAMAIIDGGADAIIIETGQDLLEMKAASCGARAAMDEKARDLVLMAQCTLANNGRMLLGTEVSAFMSTLAYLGVEVIGLNCSTGPVEMEKQISFLSENCPVSVSCMPNAGLPIEEDGKAVYPLGPAEMADIMAGYIRKYNLDVVGGCCGTTPEHILQMRKVIGKAKKRKRPGKVFFSSSYTGFDMGETERPVKVGERINTQGSRKMKELLLEENYDSIVELGKGQQKAGSGMLDVCSVLTERSTEKRDAVILTRRLAESVRVPLMIDSTDPDVIEAACESYPGTPFINSVNLEDGGAKADRIFPIAVKHAGFVVNLVIDQHGMAKTAERKIEIAERLYRIGVMKHGLDSRRMVFDMLTFTLGTGEKEYADSAVNTLKSIKELKKRHPEVLTVLGVSNVSFGLSKESRKVLNMVFLDQAVKAGLDMAIVNPAEYLDIKDIPSQDRKLAEDLVLNRGKDPLSRYIDNFSGKVPSASGQDARVEEMSVSDRIKKCLLDRDKTSIVPLLDEARETMAAEDIINNVLMDAMREVGDKLDSGEMVLPYVLQSAEVMKKAIEHLEQFISLENTGKKGKIILATVFGDVHDIGKNLVKMVLENNGFTVIDLGKQVPVERIVEEAKKQDVDAVGLSALLVSTARHMKVCVQSLHDAGLEYPVLIGGAPTNKRFAREISALKDDSIYKGGVFYSKDAFTGLKIMQAMDDPEGKRRTLDEYYNQFGTENKSVRAQEHKPHGASIENRESRIEKVPTPPFFGPRALSNIPADDVFAYIDEHLLFDIAWGSKLKDPEAKELFIEKEYRPLLGELKEEAIRNNWLDLKAVYGYFKCRVNGENIDLIDDSGEVIESIQFPRDGKGFSLADYFAAGPEGHDIAAFQAVTVGGRVNDAIGKLNDSNESTRALYLHGFSVTLAEALAAYLHDRIRGELGLGKDRGKRYSPGYPAWGDLADQKKLFKLLDVEKRIGVTLTEGFQMVPEQSTTAMIIYNEKAAY